MKPTLLVLAAGIGSRYGSLKQLDRLGPSGETIIDYSVYDAIRAGFGKVIFIIKKETESDFREAFIRNIEKKVPVECVFQELNKVPGCVRHTDKRVKPWGTGHAVLMAAEKIREPFAVINADDFYGRNAYQAVADFFKDAPEPGSEQYCMVGYEIGKTLSEHGAVSRGVCVSDQNGNLLEITEQTKISKYPEGIGYRDQQDRLVLLPEKTVVSMNFWGFTPSFFEYLSQGFYEFYLEQSHSETAEFYIPSMVNQLIRSRQVSVKILNCREQWFGMTYREDREMVAGNLRRLVGEGIYPENLWQ
ncbi:MAG TPA: sugar phosphate nucleotidyltransferase [Bacteroidales bacterium]|nr:sugar phosphate nucleotidyltransferase [Bacteroidales bacterium]